MEKREAFRGISIEPEESVEEVNWKQTTTAQLQEEEVIQAELVTEVIIEAVTINPAQLQEEEVIIPMEVTWDIMVKQRKQVL